MTLVSDLDLLFIKGSLASIKPAGLPLPFAAFSSATRESLWTDNLIIGLFVAPICPGHPQEAWAVPVLNTLLKWSVIC